MHHHSIFILYLGWAVLVGGFVIAMVVLFTTTPLSRLIARPERHFPDD